MIEMDRGRRHVTFPISRLTSADLRFVNTAALTVRNRIEEVAEKLETLLDFSATFSASGR